MRIVALSGPKYSGKDTAAKILFAQNRSHNLFQPTRFAFGTKSICQLVFGYSEELLEDPLLKETKTDTWPYLEPRWPMMDVANWFREHYGPDVWVRLWERLATESADDWACHVVTDLRFPEELEMLQRHKALIVYVERPEAEERLAAKQGAGDAMALNPSEAHYKLIRENATVTLQNDYTIAHMHGQMLAIVRNYYGHWSEWKAPKNPLEMLRTGEYDRAE